MSQSNAGYDVWGVVASVLSLLVFVPGIFNHLPYQEAEFFDSALADTRCVLYGYIEDGCLESAFSSQVNLQLSTIMDASRTIDAYRTGNFFHQIVGLLRLEAYKLQRKRKEVDNIRTAIKMHAAEVLGRRVLERAVQPAKQDYSPSDASSTDDLASSADSTLQGEDDVEKALHSEGSTRDPPAYCPGFVERTKANTPKHRRWQTMAKRALKGISRISKRR